MLQKVTAFVTRAGSAGAALLLFRHPNAGIQLPAGTVEEGETPEAAVLREVFEETGLRHGVRIVRGLGQIEETLPGHVFVTRRTKVYARPDPASFDWAEFRRGIAVIPERDSGAFRQVTYEEWDRFPAGEYITYRITGWAPADALSPSQRRHYFHLTAEAGGPPAWTQAADNHVFEPFWARLNALPPLVEPQQGWLDHVMRNLV